MRSFRQVDVFTAEPYRGNPVAVVADGDGMTDEEMARFANWTNLSETTFILPPTDPAADYRVRIFTPSSELPFAGHPTIGTCHAWLEAGGSATEGRVVQECGVGLVTLRQSNGRLSFAAPDLIRGGSVDEADVEKVCAVLGVDRSSIVAAQWADNGPGWLAVMLASADEVLALTPDFSQVERSGHGVVGEYPIGIVGPRKIGVAGPTGETNDESAIEVRAFFSNGAQATEDPVTGSLNASLAQWLLAEGHDGSPIGLSAPYVASQGTALGRAGRVHIDEADGQVWVGGDAVTAIVGEVKL